MTKKLMWVRLDDDWNDPSTPQGYTYRAAVPGGWLVSVWAGTEQDQSHGGGLTFLSDPKHDQWIVREIKPKQKS